MTLARRHRGSLGESMETVIGVNTLDDLVAVIQADLAPYMPPPGAGNPGPPITRETVHVASYGGVDERIGWDTYIVTLDGFGVWGFTNGPTEPQKEAA